MAIFTPQLIYKSFLFEKKKKNKKLEYKILDHLGLHQLKPLSTKNF